LVALLLLLLLNLIILLLLLLSLLLLVLALTGLMPMLRLLLRTVAPAAPTMHDAGLGAFGDGVEQLPQEGHTVIEQEGLQPRVHDRQGLLGRSVALRICTPS
jgi:hypothetical protein